MKKETKIKILDILSVSFCIMFFVTMILRNWPFHLVTIGVGICFIIFLTIFSKKERFLYGLLVPFVAPLLESIYYLVYFRKKLFGLEGLFSSQNKS
ncbi:MAG: hypothetical protein PHD05_07870 [Sphaerochaetaceae bacterium]|nr:hypothetical protein [Sphaerochaetaceae bacterium]